MSNFSNFSNRIFSGTVVHGAKEGRKLGFPTLNMSLAGENAEFEKDFRAGVYTVICELHSFNIEHNNYTEPRKHLSRGYARSHTNLLDDQLNSSTFANTPLYAGLLHYGPRSTFGETKMQWEIYLLQFDAEVYDYQVSFIVLEKLRDSVKFSSLDELITQMKLDKRQGEAELLV